MNQSEQSHALSTHSVQLELILNGKVEPSCCCYLTLGPATGIGLMADTSSLSLSSATIRNAFLLLFVATSTWLCGLMAVNNSILAFYYIFDVLCLVQV